MSVLVLSNINGFIWILVVLMLADAPKVLADDAGFKFRTPVDHCVAWKAHKKMFLVSNSEPVGINCAISTRLVQSSDQRWFAEINVPVRQFDSNEPKRDAEVVNILHGNTHPNIVVRTSAMSRDALEALWGMSKGVIDVEIAIGTKRFPLKLNFQSYRRGSIQILKGVVNTAFTKLGMQPPAVGGGVVAKVQDPLQLHVQVRRDRFLD